MLSRGHAVFAGEFGWTISEDVSHAFSTSEVPATDESEDVPTMKVSSIHNEFSITRVLFGPK